MEVAAAIAEAARVDCHHWNELDRVCAGPHALACAQRLVEEGTASEWLRAACANGAMRLAQWLLQRFPGATYNTDVALAYSVRGEGQPQMVRLVLTLILKDKDHMSYIDKVARTVLSGTRQVIKAALAVLPPEELRRCARTFLARLCTRGDVGLVCMFDAKCAIMIDDVRWQNGTALGIACACGHLALAQWLTSRFDLTAADVLGQFGPDWHAIYGCGGLPLACACARGHLHIMQWAAERFRLAARDIRAMRALIYACDNDHLGLARWLTERYGLTARDARAEKQHMLHQACMTGKLQTAKWLVARFDLGADGSRISMTKTVLYPDTNWSDEQTGIQALQWLDANRAVTRKHAKWAYRWIVPLTTYPNILRWLIKRYGIAPENSSWTQYAWSDAKKWMNAWAEEEGGWWDQNTLR